MLRQPRPILAKTPASNASSRARRKNIMQIDTGSSLTPDDQALVAMATPASIEQKIAKQEPITVVTHSADFDGICCREIARHWLGSEGVTFIGWTYGDPLIPFPETGTVYVMDLSPDCFQPVEHTQVFMERVIWIDHHRTAIQKYSNAMTGYRIEGVAACRLAWQWFKHQFAGVTNPAMLPRRWKYVECLLDEPMAVRFIGQYDVWDKHDPRAETFHYGLEAWDTDWRFRSLDLYWPAIMQRGELAQQYARNIAKKISPWVLKWEGLTFLCLNTHRFDPMLFEDHDVPENKHDALLTFCFKNAEWIVSLRHSKHRQDLDLSKIATAHGGGGHPGACGFSADVIPFDFSLKPAKTNQNY